MVRYCDDCPWYHSNSYTDSWGCILFGEECKNCKKFDEDVGGCYYSQKKLERMVYELKKKWNHAEKMAESYSTDIKFFFKNHNRYTPNRKGGHRHNHIYNVCHRITFRSKSARHRVSREDKSFFIATFYTSLMLNPQILNDILKRRKA